MFDNCSFHHCLCFSHLISDKIGLLPCLPSFDGFCHLRGTEQTNFGVHDKSQVSFREVLHLGRELILGSGLKSITGFDMFMIICYWFIS